MKNMYDKALEDAEASIRLKPEYSTAYCSKGVALRHLKRFDDAFVSYQDAMAQFPDDESLKVNFVRDVLNQLSDYGKTFNYYAFTVKPEAFSSLNVSNSSSSCDDTSSFDSLWVGRKVRLLPLPESRWREAKVVGLEQHRSRIEESPSAPVTITLSMAVEFHTVDEEEKQSSRSVYPLDVVAIQGLECNTEHNGKIGICVAEEDSKDGRISVDLGNHLTIRVSSESKLKRILNLRPGDLCEAKGSTSSRTGKVGTFICFDPNDGRCLVKFAQGREEYRVLPGDLQKVPSQIIRQICRINVDGGGTLVGNDQDSTERISFEWIDDVEPAVELPQFEEDMNEKSIQPEWIGTSGYCLPRSYAEGVRGRMNYGYFDVYKASPLSTAPERLGGNNPSRAVSSENYDLPQCLPRDAALPPLRESESIFLTDKVKKAYNKIYNGDFTLEWCETVGPPSDEFLAIQPSFRSTNCYSLVLNVIGEAGEDLFLGRLVNINFIGLSDTCMGVIYYGFNNDYLRTSLTEAQKFSLAYRVIHWFVRCNGANLTAKDSAPFSVCSFLSTEFMKLKRWKEAVDAATIYADLSLYLGRDDEGIGKSFNSLGEALEANGKFYEAGLIYQEGAKLVSAELFVCHLHLNSGLAFKRATDYENAEKEYAASFQLAMSISNGDLNSDLTDTVITNFLVLYDEWIREIGDGNSGSIATGVELLFPTFAALLFLARFEAQQGGLCQQVVKKLGKSYSKHNLKSSISSRPAAKRALISAASSPDVQTFRAKILECLHPKSTTVTNIQGGGRRSGQSKENVQHARDMVRESAPMQFGKETVVLCSQAGCCNRGTNFKRCPCKVTSYCSKACQTAHWRNHKKTCMTLEKNRPKETIIVAVN